MINYKDPNAVLEVFREADKNQGVIKNLAYSLPYWVNRAIKAEAELAELKKYHVEKQTEYADQYRELDKRKEQAEADNAALREVIKESLTAFEIALEEAQGEDWPEIRKLRDKCKQALATDSGADLLKELEGLRKVREAAKEVCGTAQPIYKHGESGLEVEEICRANTLKMEALAQSLKALAEAEKEEVL